MSIDRVLVADDEPLARDFLAEALSAHGLEVVTAPDGEEATRLFADGDFDLVLTDFRLPGLDGLSVLKEIRERSPGVPVVLVTAHGSVDVAVRAMRLGAADFLQKPFSPEAIDALLARLGARLRLEEENDFLRSELAANRGDDEIVAESAAMRAVLKKIDRVAETSETVLLQGETGTGKELLAWRIHRKSPRSDGPFVRVSCASVSETLLASELFGAERGAIDGATRKRPGRFEIASGGTLVLDEIAELPKGLQAKLLRVIETKVVERLGGVRPVRTDVRIVATTHRDLVAETALGRFREDLFFRVHVMPVRIPPLRERKDDVRALTRHYASAFAAEHGVEEPTFTPDAMHVMVAHPWPGNVRELRNSVLRAVVMNRGGVLEAEDVAREILPPRSEGGSDGELVGRTVGDVERDLILKTLDRTRFNRTEAARLLGLTPRTLFNKIRLYENQGHIVVGRPRERRRPAPPVPEERT